MGSVLSCAPFFVAALRGFAKALSSFFEVGVMSLSADDVRKIAHLARLQVTDEQLPQFTQSLASIFEFVAQMEAVDTEAVEPMAHPMDAVQRLREDEVSESDQREKFQAIAPQVDAGLYLVPRVIE